MHSSHGLAAPSHTLKRPKLFIDAQHGLSNRLRAMASAAAIARETERLLVVIWRPDSHCQARLGDLIDYEGPVIEDETSNLFQDRAEVVFNYMEVEAGAAFDAPIDLASHSDQDVYIRSAYTLKSPHIRIEHEEAFLRSLYPVDAVRALVARVRHPNQVAAHIRMGTGPGFDHLPYENPNNWPNHRHQEIVEWRAKSHVERFIARLDQLSAVGRAETIFVAADLAETYDRLAARYGDRLVWLERDLYGREAEQIQYALADLLLLTQADLFLASTWSSFSDLAHRLAAPGHLIERSGIDF